MNNYNRYKKYIYRSERLFSLSKELHLCTKSVLCPPTRAITTFLLFLSGFLPYFFSPNITSSVQDVVQNDTQIQLVLLHQILSLVSLRALPIPDFTIQALGCSPFEEFEVF